MNKAPHPNAARVLANWLASKESLSMYSELQGQAPVRNDIDPIWLPKTVLPQPGVDYLDTYDPEFVLKKRAKIRTFFGTVVK